VSTRGVAIVVLVLALTACRAISGSSPAVTPDPLADLDAETRQAIELRQQLGLRADLAWVQQVAADPNADTQLLAIPLTPAETLEIERRFAQSDEAAQIANAYATEHRDSFAGLYIDQKRGSRIVVLFTADVGAHQAALDALWGEPGFIVVEAAAFTQSALHHIQEEIGDASDELRAQGITLLSISAGYLNESGYQNNVEVEAKSDNPEARDILEAFGPPGAVAVQIFPSDQPWSNPAGGPGWRFLGSFRTDLPYTVGVATNPAELASELDRYGIAAGLPEWDPATEIIAIFSEGVGSSCPEVRIDAVTFDGEDGLVFPTLSDPLSPRACTSDLRGGQTFVVALARDSLPGRQFTLILEPDLPHLGELQVTLE
jgi:hypothetical protein